MSVLNPSQEDKLDDFRSNGPETVPSVAEMTPEEIQDMQADVSAGNVANLNTQPTPGMADLTLVQQGLQGVQISNIPQGPQSAVGELFGSTANIASEYGQSIAANVAQINPDMQLAAAPQMPQQQFQPQPFHL